MSRAHANVPLMRRAEDNWNYPDYVQYAGTPRITGDCKVVGEEHRNSSAASRYSTFRFMVVTYDGRGERGSHIVVKTYTAGNWEWIL